jgi:prophage maintenance system killer protein
MRPLEVADLVVIASRTLGLSTDETLSLLDVEAAERALMQAQPAENAGNPASDAANLLCTLAQGKPLVRGCRQVALAATLQFLALNGWEIDTNQPEAVAAVVAGAEADVLGAAEVADWLARRLRPLADAKEKPMRARPALPLPGRIRKAKVRSQPAGTFRRFTDGARRAVHLAHEEARLLGHSQAGSEHLLLGLVHDEEGLAGKALESLGLSLGEVYRQVTEITGQGHDRPTGHIPFTPRAKKALELALREAVALGHTYVGPEHVLLSLLSDEHGIAARILTGLGASHARTQERVVDLLIQREQDDRQAQRTGHAIPAELAGTVDELHLVWAQKEAALGAEDFEAAKKLRDRERQLLADKGRLERQMSAGWGPSDIRQALIGENQELRRELDRLRGVLRGHGIEPDDGTAHTA